MRLQAFVGAFTALWFGGLLLGAAMLLRAGLQEGFVRPAGRPGRRGLRASEVCCLRLDALVSVAFWTEVSKARRALREGLGCRKREPGNRLVRG